ncbi:hypothetical protein Bbelb_292830 [Branchiostoma belcheri]|nr:hypothetical protein Bbelb_292830 [Branchiostoma belcheri]
MLRRALNVVRENHGRNSGSYRDSTVGADSPFTLCIYWKHPPSGECGGDRSLKQLSESSEKKERKATAVTQKRARLEANRQTAHPGSDLKARAPTTQAGPAALPPGVHPAPSTPLRPDCDHNRHQHHAIPQTDMGQFRGKRFLGSRAAKPRSRKGGPRSGCSGVPRTGTAGPREWDQRVPGTGATGPESGAATHGAVHGHFLPCTGMYRDRVRAYNVQYTTCTQKVVHFRECTGHVRDWTRFVCRERRAQWCAPDKTFQGGCRVPPPSGSAWALLALRLRCCRERLSERLTRERPSERHLVEASGREKGRSGTPRARDPLLATVSETTT